MKQILIHVGPDGHVTIETKNYEGASCLGATRDLEKALGLTIIDQPTSEFWSEVIVHPLTKQETR